MKNSALQKKHGKVMFSYREDKPQMRDKQLQITCLTRACIYNMILFFKNLKTQPQGKKTILDNGQKI